MQNVSNSKKNGFLVYTWECPVVVAAVVFVVAVVVLVSGVAVAVNDVVISVAAAVVVITRPLILECLFSAILIEFVPIKLSLVFFFLQIKWSCF